MTLARFIVGDVFEGIAALAAGGVTVDLVLTSPPFLALRSYLPADHPDKGLEIGGETTPGEFLDVMLDVVEACATVLASHGSIAVELGDTYSGSGGAGGDYLEGGWREGQGRPPGLGRLARYSDERGNPDGMRDSTFQGGNTRSGSGAGWPLGKSLCMLPSLFAGSLAYGRNLLNPERTTDPWRVRNLVAWVRPNPPVGDLADKVRPATSYVTWACKERDRWFDLDAVRTPSDYDRPNLKGKGSRPGGTPDGQRPNGSDHTTNPAGAPPLDWWKISPRGYKGSHYAVFPPELCRIPIEASCPRRVCRTCGTPSRRITETEQVDTGRTTNGPQSIDRKHKEGGSAGFATRTESRSTTHGWSTCGCPGTDGIRLDGFHTGAGWRPGVVLDPFAGTGTTLLAATGRGRDAIGIDLDPRNARLVEDRLGMWVEVEQLEPAGFEEVVRLDKPEEKR